jgi:CheY-like chemotaxis protein
MAGALRGIRVLVLEDGADIREVFTILLNAEGADVITAGTGGEAMRLATRHVFDVVLTDLGLPDVSGDVVIRHIIAAARQRP